MEIRVCNNDDCDWVGYVGDTVHPKHAESLCLCPECKETTEEVTPSWFKEIREEARAVTCIEEMKKLRIKPGEILAIKIRDGLSPHKASVVVGELVKRFSKIWKEILDKNDEKVFIMPYFRPVEDLQSVFDAQIKGLSHQKEKLQSEFKKAVYWLIKIYTACGRKGWEEGPTEKEVFDDILSFLGNRELIPSAEEYADNVKKLLEEVESDPF